MTIYFNCENQSLKRADNEVLAAQSANYLFCEFSFDESWASFTPTAVFERDGIAYHVLLDNDMRCPVPAEVLREGYFTLSLIGVKTDGEIALYRATSQREKVRVYPGPLLEGENTAEPTPTQMEQALELLAQARELAGENISQEEIRDVVNEYFEDNPVNSGSTPVKGTDYWTEADKEEIVSDMASMITLSREENTLFLKLDGNVLTSVDLTVPVGYIIEDPDGIDILVDGIGEGRYTLRYEGVEGYADIVKAEVT